MKRCLEVRGVSIVMEKGVACLFTLVLVFSVSCEDQSGAASVDGRVPGITDGVRDSGHPSVGLLSNSCTGTLIGDRSVLTAAHCVTQGGRATFKVGGKTYSSSKVFVHDTADIALVVLKTSVTGVEPSPVNLSKPKVGQRILLVGFGQTSENGGGLGTKRKGSNTISRVSSTMIYFKGTGGKDSSNCYGDSGGPAFLLIDGQEVVAGVTSGGEKPCGTYAYDTRVDVFVDWLERKSNGDIVFPDEGDGDGDEAGCEGTCSSSCQCSWLELGCQDDGDCVPGLYCEMRPQLGNRCLKKKAGDSTDNSGQVSDIETKSGCEGTCSNTCQCSWLELGCQDDGDCMQGLYCKMRPQLGNRCLKN